MASIATAVMRAPGSKAQSNQRFKNFGRSLTYQIAGLPIAVRAALRHTDGTPEFAVRRAYARRYWRPWSHAEAAQLALAVLVSPFVLLALEITFVSRNGGAVARRFGRPVHRQLLDQLRLYFTAGVLPPWYYIFELHRHPESAYAREFIYRWESKGGVLRLLKEGDREPASELSDKAEFAEQCRRLQIRTVPVLAVFRDGKAEMRASREELATDLFVKPVCGKGGKGAERWDYSAGLYGSSRNRWLTREELFKRLKARSRDVDLLVQSRLHNHDALNRLNNGALSTVRVLTCLNEAGEPELVGAALRMAMGGNHVVDNLHAGGIAAAVNLESGRLGPASNLGGDCRLGWLDRHPDTGARITGAQLPRWGEVRDFAIRAHKAFGDRVVVGWDIAITPDGPVLVEGNGAPDLDIMQRFARRGLMAGRLGVLLAFHLGQLGLDQPPVSRRAQAAVSIPRSPSLR